MKDPIIFSLGGSLIVPDQIDAKFLKKFKHLIEKYIDQYRQFVIITGGGKTCRRYQQAAVAVNSPDDEDLDWLGIHASRLNGHLLRTIFRKHADPQMIANPTKMTPRDAKILIGAGHKPGSSTDYVATLFAKAYNMKTVVNLSNIEYVYDKDPRKFDDAKPLEKVSWADFRKIVGDKWTPGANLPFDPVASKLGEKLGLKVIVMKGTDLDNLEAYLDGQEFKGTVIG